MVAPTRTDVLFALSPWTQWAAVKIQYSLITEALLTTNEKLRENNYLRILTELHEKAVYLPISFSGAVALSGQKLKDFEMAHMTYIVPFEDMELKE